MIGARDSPLSISVLGETLAVCRLDPQEDIPAWATDSMFSSVTRTPDELSVVCPGRQVPAGVACERHWRALKLEGTFDLDLVGILASVAAPLAEAGVGIFAIATHDTDYVLVREAQLGLAVSALSELGHNVSPQGSETPETN